MLLQIQHVVPEVTIPPEVTPENVTTHIVDSSARIENRDQLDAEIRKADVICIVYAVNLPDSFKRISSHWLPYIRALGRNVPVVLVGNKIDSRGENVANEALEDEIMPIMEEFKVRGARREGARGRDGQGRMDRDNCTSPELEWTVISSTFLRLLWSFCLVCGVGAGLLHSDASLRSLVGT